MHSALKPEGYSSSITPTIWREESRRQVEEKNRELKERNRQERGGGVSTKRVVGILVENVS